MDWELGTGREARTTLWDGELGTGREARTTLWGGKLGMANWVRAGRPVPRFWLGHTLRPLSGDEEPLSWCGRTRAS